MERLLRIVNLNNDYLSIHRLCEWYFVVLRVGFFGGNWQFMMKIIKKKHFVKIEEKGIFLLKNTFLYDKIQ